MGGGGGVPTVPLRDMWKRPWSTLKEPTEKVLQLVSYWYTKIYMASGQWISTQLLKGIADRDYTVSLIEEHVQLLHSN